MKIIFFGLGSIGKRHARLMKENFNHKLYAFRSNKDSKNNKLIINEIYDLKDIKSIKPEVAFITNPTYEHIKYATFCAKNGIDLFIEKPISHSMEGIDSLINIVNKNKIKTYVAYFLRFHPVIRWLKRYLEENKPIHIRINSSSYLPNWRNNSNHLKDYSAFKEKGGGVILDLSHEIDYLYYLLGPLNVIGTNTKKISDVTVTSEDFADILIKTKKGVECNVHLNFLSRVNRREIIIEFTDCTIIADLISNKISIIKDNGTKIINLNIKRDDIYLAQINYFLKNLKEDRMMNNLEEASKVFKIILKIKEGAKE